MHKEEIITHWDGGYREEEMNSLLIANIDPLNHVFRIQKSFLDLSPCFCVCKMQFRQRIMEQNAQTICSFSPVQLYSISSTILLFPSAENVSEFFQSLIRVGEALEMLNANAECFSGKIFTSRMEDRYALLLSRNPMAPPRRRLWQSL